jgi:hypothetical protein
MALDHLSAPVLFAVAGALGDDGDGGFLSPRLRRL